MIFKRRDALNFFEDSSAFQATIRAAGFEPPQYIEAGKFYRFPGIGKKKSNRAGWCVLFHDGLGGCFGDWASGLSQVWQAKHKERLSPDERAAFKRHIEYARTMVALEREKTQEAAAIRAENIRKDSIFAPDNHPYLVLKGIKANGALLYKRMLVLPIVDTIGRITSLQFIDSSGKKMMLSGGRKEGCFIVVQGNLMQPPNCIVITEGWATGVTLSEQIPTALVLAAIDAGNLKSVAMGARYCWPDAKIIIAGDDDRLTPGNPGATKAREAAIAADAAYILPQWPDDAPNSLSDFNDLAVWNKKRRNGHV